MLRILASLSTVVVSAFACTDQRATARPSDGVLVLEVGGDHPSLRAALQAHGVEVPAPRPARETEPEREPESEHGPPAVAESPLPGLLPVVDATSPPAPPVPGSPDDFFVVKLARGQTLIHLAKKHLGDGKRFRELLTLNGWTDADARRLREDESIKIPRETSTVGGSRRP